jgi:hypothetical protein
MTPLGLKTGVPRHFTVSGSDDGAKWDDPGRLERETPSARARVRAENAIRTKALEPQRVARIASAGCGA